ncbi:MAG: 3D domain-containing protein [Peptoniphilaceae bacterium]
MSLLKNSVKKKIVTMGLGIVALSGLVTMGFSTILANNVNIIINGEEESIVTYSSTVEDFLKTEGIELDNKEVVVPSLDTKIEDDMDIVIRSPKSYQIKDGEELRIAESTGLTVGEVLKELKIELGANDVVTPKITEKLEENQSIVIERVRKETFDNSKEIGFETEKRENPNMYKDEKKVIQKGVPGQVVETLQNTFVNDKLVSMDIISSKVNAEPIKEIVEVGTKDRPVVQSAGKFQGKNVRKVITMQATAYDPTAGSLTAMGTRARVGAVAVDPRVIPLGSKLYIESTDGFPSYGYAVAEDTGGAIKGNSIDLFYNSNSQANRFGRRNVKVYVLD